MPPMEWPTTIGRKPAAAKVAICGAQMRALPPMPWMNTTGGAEEFAGDALFMAAPSAALGAGAPGPYRRMMLAATCRDNWPRGPVRCLSGGLALERRVAIGLQ